MKFLYLKEKENEIVKATYEMSKRIYRFNAAKMRRFDIDMEDFKQDAALYILGLYRKDYMYLDESTDPRGMIFKMLVQYSRNYIRKYERHSKRHAKSLNIKDSRGLEILESISKEEELDPEEWSVEQLESERVKKLFEEIAEQFETLPFRTRKHQYIGKSNKTFSEYNLAKMIFDGYNMKSILEEYNVYTKNIGKSSKAVFVNKKVREVSDKIKSIVSKLDEDDREAIVNFAISW